MIPNYRADVDITRPHKCRRWSWDQSFSMKTSTNCDNIKIWIQHWIEIPRINLIVWFMQCDLFGMVVFLIQRLSAKLLYFKLRWDASDYFAVKTSLYKVIDKSISSFDFSRWCALCSCEEDIVLWMNSTELYGNSTINPTYQGKIHRKMQRSIIHSWDYINSTSLIKSIKCQIHHKIIVSPATIWTNLTEFVTKLTWAKSMIPRGRRSPGFPRSRPQHYVDTRLCIWLRNW